MSCNQPLSEVTRIYLCRFEDILEEMIADMTEAKLTGSLSHNFIVQMIPHHRAAIEMSRNVLQYTTCIPVQNIAQTIIREQTRSIRQYAEDIGRVQRGGQYGAGFVPLSKGIPANNPDDVYPNAGGVLR